MTQNLTDIILRMKIYLQAKIVSRLRLVIISLLQATEILHYVEEYQKSYKLVLYYLKNLLSYELSSSEDILSIKYATMEAERC